MTDHRVRDCDEFVCRECRSNVYSFPPREPPPTLCSTCWHLNQFVPDPHEREQMRERLMGKKL